MSEAKDPLGERVLALATETRSWGKLEQHPENFVQPMMDPKESQAEKYLKKPTLERWRRKIKIGRPVLGAEGTYREERDAK